MSYRPFLKDQYITPPIRPTIKPNGPVMKIPNNGPWLALGNNSIGPINPRRNENTPVIKPILRILEMV